MNKRGGILANLSHTLTIFVDKRGGIQFCDSKNTYPHDGKCGGGGSRELKTVTHDGVWNGTVAPPPWLAAISGRVFAELNLLLCYSEKRLLYILPIYYNAY